MKTLISALCSLALMTFPPPNVGAKSYVAPQGFLFTVNTTDDHNDFRCDGTDCTLREAIQAATTLRRKTPLISALRE
ncbi:MAG TPA: CSLREA domain-containing protein [Pyrinomonadaceae bacterium]|nr:CSLREA domain-containing protein [Pyrinomonadaceae bacterium]